MSKTIYRNHKDNVFCLLHREKANLLELYNALNGTDYQDIEDLTVATLPNAICIQYRNDAAYMFNNDLNLYEQQSTDNPNIALRLLHYISEEYRHMVPVKALYRQSGIKIPTPHFVVFYNGTKAIPEKQVYRLSDLYENAADEPELELKVTILNINDGNNRELMEKCKTLQGYMKFVNKVRERISEMSAEDAVRSAVDECIEEDILKDFFLEYKEEVVGMGIWGFDEELYQQARYEDGVEAGRKEGESLLGKLVSVLMQDKKYADVNRAVSDEKFRIKLYRQYHLL